MLEAVSRHGYPATTVGELVALAGVSKSTFYEHFADKQECFLATFDEIVAQVFRQSGPPTGAPATSRATARGAGDVHGDGRGGTGGGLAGGG